MDLTAASVTAWLLEDIGSGDLTSETLITPNVTCRATLQLKEPGVVSGLDVCKTVFDSLDPGIVFETRYHDGDVLDACELVQLEGSARAILAGERLALNLLGRMSGIATLTWRYVHAVAGTGTTILDTRKTTPGLRALEKAAVRHGGGANHRAGLDDGVLIKDNHIRLAGGIHPALTRARQTGAKVMVECETLADVEKALDAGADRILLDNMNPLEHAAAVSLVNGQAELEATGGITLLNVRQVAGTGVNYISIGALTHTARSLDVSLDVHT